MTWFIILISVYLLVGLVTFCSEYNGWNLGSSLLSGLFWPIHILGELIE